MILTILIGNTNTRFVWFEGRRHEKTLALPTSALRGARLPQPGKVCGIAVASVVPSATRHILTSLGAASGLEPFVVGPRTRAGLRFRYRRSELGTDRVCIAVGARYRLPDRDLIIFDFGTATTVNVVLREGVFTGGAILPGIKMCLDGLAAGTARLPGLVPGRNLNPVQRNTRAAMQAGVAALFAGGIDHIINRIERNIGRRLLVVATGGAAVVARRYASRIGLIRPYLASDGLAGLWYLNHCG
jgi:type III pantothenate kinase